MKPVEVERLSQRDFQVQFAERAWEIRFASMLVRPAPLTRALTIFLVVVHIILAAITAKALLGGAENSIDDTIRLALVGAKSNSLIDGGEWWRFASAMFLHAGWVHLLFNVMALHYLGRIVENALGVSGFLLIYFGGGLLASYFSYLYSDNLSVGASGSVFALLGSAAAYGLYNRNRIPPRLKRFLVVSPLVWIGINVAFSLSIPNIDLAAHAGGLVVGILLTPFLGDRILLRAASIPNVLRKGILLVLMCVTVASFGFMGPRLFGFSVQIPSNIESALLWGSEVGIPDGWTMVDESPRKTPCDWLAPMRRDGDEEGLRDFRVYRGGLLVNYLCVLSEPMLGGEANRILKGLHEFNPDTSPLKRVDQGSSAPIYEFTIPNRPSEGPRYRVLVTIGANDRVYMLWVYEKLIDFYLPLMEGLHRWRAP
jgi:membrane associated rhomboid family serine protease